MIRRRIGRYAAVNRIQDHSGNVTFPPDPASEDHVRALHKAIKVAGVERERERVGRERKRERERERATEREKVRESESERDRETGRDRDNGRDRDREIARGRERERERETWSSEDKVHRFTAETFTKLSSIHSVSSESPASGRH